MKKIPTLFERDWEGDRSRVIDKVTPECQWVIDGEGHATQKLDGTCCMILAGTFYKRREVTKDQNYPADFTRSHYDATTGKSFGWIPVHVKNPEDKWHIQAFDLLDSTYQDGTYELIGPKIQGNPEEVQNHVLVNHKDSDLIMTEPLLRSFEGLNKWLEDHVIEGLVFHHEDGRMAKIKLRDFGHKRTKKELNT